MNDLPAPTSRARHGRWLGGVCAGLAARWGVPPARVRLAFVLGALALGLGVLVYLAAWLILPAESEDGVTAGQRGIVLLAQACGALLGLATLAVAGAAATVFGFGWVVVALAAAVLVGTLAGWARLGPGLGAAADRSPRAAVGRAGRRRAARRAELDVRRSDPTHARRAAARPSDAAVSACSPSICGGPRCPRRGGFRCGSRRACGAR